MFRGFIYIFIFGLSMILSAQEPVFVHMENVSNLPDVEFYDVAEDSQNYIWLAADKGLYRYDGKSYQHFSNPEQKSNSLFQLKFDTEGTLWCNNIYGQFFYIENDSLKLFYDASSMVKGQLSPYVVTQKYIRIFTPTGIYDIDRKSKNVTKIFNGFCISNANKKGINYTFVINVESNLKKHRIYKFNGNKSTKILEIDSLKHIQSPMLFAFEKAQFFIHKNNKGNIIYIIDSIENTAQKILTPVQLKNETIYKLLSFEGEYWFLTSAGVFVFKLEGNSLMFKEQLFKTEAITDVQLDFNDNYWFTTLYNGVFVSPNLSIRRVDINRAGTKITASCSLQDNQFVLGTNNSLLLFYENDRLVKTLQLPGKKIVGNLYFDVENQYLIVSINASDSFVLDLKTGNTDDFTNTFSGAKTFSKIDTNTLFYGNYRQGIVYKTPFELPDKKIIRDSRVNTSIVTNNNLFVSYIDSFYKYDVNTFAFEEIKFNSKSLLVNSIAAYNNSIWLATQHYGLLRYENDSLVKSRFQLGENLQINKIKCDDELLWISTDTGLIQYNTKTNLSKSFSAQDGLNTTLKDFLILQDKIIITFPNGFYVLTKNEDLFKSFKTSAVRIETLSINDRDTLVQTNYKLPHILNNIGIKFNSNGFQANQHVNYHYRVKEIDTNWQSIPLNTHFVNFNSLASGKYTFELKAQNVSAVSPVFARPISFEIAKPFWETYWFFGLVLLTAFGVIRLYFRNRLKQKEAQRIAEIDKILIDKKITNLRLENLRSQMNPHFIFNALNSIQDYIISNEKELASSYLVTFSRLIRMYLDYSQQNEISLQEEFNALKLYLELEKVRFEDELEYKIEIDKKLEANQINVPSLFIQPYVENALKHGLLHKKTDRKLRVEAKVLQQNILQITVEDNGIGRVQSEKLKRSNHQHKPFATKANQERVHLYKNSLKRNITIAIEDLYNANQTALGTKVVIRMPI